MSSYDTDNFDFKSLDEELRNAVIEDEKYWRENDAKFRAVRQKVASYEEFRDIVNASLLKPLEKKDKAPEKIKQPWNVFARSSGDIPQVPETQKATEMQIPFIIPKTYHEFTREWNQQKLYTKSQYEMLMLLTAEELAVIFKTEIPNGLLGDILCVLEEHYTEEEFLTTIEILEFFSNSSRFTLCLQFLNADEQHRCYNLFQKLALDVTQNKNIIIKQKFDELKMKYSS
ncbi:coiled-coil domain-containing protein 103-like [Argonauta hians]